MAKRVTDDNRGSGEGRVFYHLVEYSSSNTTISKMTFGS